jgi:hypothetical protein
MKAGGARYEDLDWGRGTHPNVDKSWILLSTPDGRWAKNFYEVIDMVSLDQEDEITVLLSAKGDKSKLLKNEVRRLNDYPSDDFVRVPLSVFPKSEKRRIRSEKKERLESKTAKKLSALDTHCVV